MHCSVLFMRTLDCSCTYVAEQALVVPRSSKCIHGRPSDRSSHILPPVGKPWVSCSIVCHIANVELFPSLTRVHLETLHREALTQHWHRAALPAQVFSLDTTLIIWVEFISDSHLFLCVPYRSARQHTSQVCCRLVISFILSNTIIAFVRRFRLIIRWHSLNSDASAWFCEHGDSMFLLWLSWSPL